MATINQPIQPIKPDDTSRHMMLSHVANEVIRRINSLWNIKGSNGIKVIKSDSNIVISWVGENETSTEDAIEAGTVVTGSITGSVENTYNCLARYA